jgi:hypothetical protein
MAIVTEIELVRNKHRVSSTLSGFFIAKIRIVNIMVAAIEMMKMIRNTKYQLYFLSLYLSNSAFERPSQLLS